MNISVVSVIHTHSVFTHVRKLVGTHTPVWFSHLSERLFFNRKKKVWVRDAAVCRGGAVSLCASSWAFSSRSKAAAVCLALRWPVGVGTQNWGILTLHASACVCVPVFMCVYVCDACVECVLSWAVGFLGLPELLHTLCDWEGEAQSQTALCFYPWVEQRAAEAAELWKSHWLNCLLHQKQNNSNTDFTEAVTFTFLKFNQSAIDYIKDFYTAENNPSILSKATKTLALFR